MPSKNTVKFYDVDAYYHVYNRGVEKRVIFHTDEDYAVFAHLLKRYLGLDPERDSSGREYTKLVDEVSLVAFCLMPNHFHLLLYQHQPEAITKLLRAVTASYVRYFNKKYNRVGGLFQGIYKAKQIDSDGYLEHITRYIHLNPHDYMQWKWSSLPIYLRYVAADWVYPELAIDTTHPERYLTFLEDYVDYQKGLDKLKSSLANC